MAATIEKVVGARRSRLAKIDEGIAADEAKVEEARRKLVELAAEEDAAVAAAKRKDPLANPYKLREPAQELRAEREKLERSLDGLEKGLAVLKSDRVAAAGEQAARELGERTAEGRDLVQKEKEARLAAARTFAELVERWGVLADVLTRKSALVAQVGGEQLVERVGIFDREAIAAWEAVSDYVVTPVPTTLAAFVDELLEASTGERTDVEAEHAAIDELNARREHGSRFPGTADDLPLIFKPAIQANPLHELVPDLRGEVARAEVSGVEVRRSAPAEEAPWPERAA